MVKRSAQWIKDLAIVSTILLLAPGCASHERPHAAPAAATASAKSTSSLQEEARRQVQTGNDLVKRGLLDEAEHAFRLALEADPTSLDAVSGLGRVHVQRGQYSEAVPLLERAARVSSQMGATFRALGDAYAATGDPERATVAYRQAIALTPSDLGSRLSLAHALTEIGAYEEAEELCEHSLRLARDDPRQLSRVHRDLGEIHCRQGKIPEALSAYYKASELSPRDVDVTRDLAACAVRGGLYVEAAAAYSRVLQLAPLDLQAKRQLGWVNFKLERYPISIAHYEAIRDSLGTVDRYYLGQAYVKSKRTDRAIEQFREVIRLDEENYKGVYCNMANAYYVANRYDSAIKMAREGLASDSGSACLRYCWAQALDKLGRHEEAIPIFEACLNDPAYGDGARRELERQNRIVRLLKSK
jgi:tetratricopeptide (TPR) repeat protein